LFKHRVIEKGTFSNALFIRCEFPFWDTILESGLFENFTQSIITDLN